MDSEEKDIEFPWRQWFSASFAAGVGGTLAVLAYVNTHFYSRPEGELLKERVTELDIRYREDIGQIRADVSSLKTQIIQWHAESEGDFEADLLRPSKKPTSSISIKSELNALLSPPSRRVSQRR